MDIAEFAGTFCLLFAGTGAIVINAASGGSGTHGGVALTFGLGDCCTAPSTPFPQP